MIFGRKFILDFEIIIEMIETRCVRKRDARKAREPAPVGG